jgi:hypothetical protein
MPPRESVKLNGLSISRDIDKPQKSPEEENRNTEILSLHAQFTDTKNTTRNTLLRGYQELQDRDNTSAR